MYKYVDYELFSYVKRTVIPICVIVSIFYFVFNIVNADIINNINLLQLAVFCILEFFISLIMVYYILFQKEERIKIKQFIFNRL